MTTAAPISIDPLETLDARFRAAIAAAFPDLPAEGIETHIAANRQPKLGDFQSNAAMPLAKRLGKNPREVAGAIIERLDLSGVAEPVTAEAIAGPGFINIRLLGDAMAASLTRLDTEQLGIEPPEHPMMVVVDLCGVNLAKQMHVGHLRSTVIGDAVARLYERLGHTVVRQNHVGDWGLPIAMVVQKLVELEQGGRDLSDLSLDELNALYRAAQAECKAEKAALALINKVGGHPKAEAELEARIEDAGAQTERAKQRLVKLQSGDPESVAAWQRVYDITMGACLATCARLHAHISEDASAGESSYRDELAGVIDDLTRRGIAEEDDGALVVRVDGLKEPCIVRKRDGGYLYATTDLAAIRRRAGTLGGERVVYCVDARQALHFKQVFGAAHKAGYDRTPDGKTAELFHAAFGNVLGEDNKPLKTRSGENIKLADLIDEAIERARSELNRRIEFAPKFPKDYPEQIIDTAEREQIADAVAIAALKYADLSTERIKDYVFSFDRMLAFEGETGPYLLYALVRTKSIFRKAADAGVNPDDFADAPLLLEEPAERALALTLLRHPGVVRAAGENHEPNRLCAHAYALAGAFSTFFDQCPVLKAETDGTRLSRLRLCALTARALEDALNTLGIPTVERM
ncbi:MAG: arginine--tRNA ligase [Phycisphaerales bacterium]|nr:arginine--tRNA ligase [Planctomycetota bacterium]MCH8509226.1 arginine--tRNA ligase [Phycisphaerales bacterium]